MDAEFFQSDAALEESAWLAKGAHQLMEIASISEDTVPSLAKDAADDEWFEYVEIGGVDQNDGFITAERVLKRDAPGRAKMRLRENMVLVSSVRPVRGTVTIVPIDLIAAVGTNGWIPIEAKSSSDLSAACLFSLFKSAFVRRQLVRRTRSSMYPVVAAQDVHSLVIPRLPRELMDTIEHLILASLDARARFLEDARLLQEAANEFLSLFRPEILQRDLEEHDPNIVSVSELRTDSGLERIDAEYHSTAFDNAVGRMADTADLVHLGDVTSRIDVGGASTIRNDHPSEVGVLMMSSLTELGVKWSAVPWGPEQYASNPSKIVQEGDIVFNCAANVPTYLASKIDVVSGVPPQLEGSLGFDVHLMRVRMAESSGLSAHYVAAFLRSDLGRLQLRRATRGLGAQIYPIDVSRVVVPIPPSDVHARIVERAQGLEQNRWAHSDAVRTAVRTVDAYLDEAASGT